jgi:hypothetical protein
MLNMRACPQAGSLLEQPVSSTHYLRDQTPLHYQPSLPQSATYTEANIKNEDYTYHELFRTIRSSKGILYQLISYLYLAVSFNPDIQ